MLPFPLQILVHIGLKSTRKRINTKFHFILQKIILTLVASAFIPFTNRTSESASVYNGICEFEQSWFTFCSSVDTLLVMMLMMPDEQG